MKTQKYYLHSVFFCAHIHYIEAQPESLIEIKQHKHYQSCYLRFWSNRFYCLYKIFHKKQ
jgi:hypothetical protein